MIVLPLPLINLKLNIYIINFLLHRDHYDKLVTTDIPSH